MGKGALVFGKAWSIEYIQMYAKGIADTAIAGSIEQVEESVKLQVSVWNCRKATVAKTFEMLQRRNCLAEVCYSLKTTS